MSKNKKLSIGDKITKNKKIFFLIFAVSLVSIFFLVYLYSFTLDFSKGKNPEFGITFSKKYAQELGLDWTQSYIAILHELKVENVRLIAYWDEIESIEGFYDFQDLDWQVSQASDRGIKIQLILGRRTPRWPECHDPHWLKEKTEKEKEQKLIAFVAEVINRYKNNKSIYLWQVENEPFLSTFGICPKLDKDLLIKEISKVKELDSQRPILITDSGELSSWQPAASVSDILGTTLYRIVWNKYLGFFDYFFLPPAFYRFKADITQFLHKNLSEVIVTELQMEPWTFNKNMVDLTKEERDLSFTPQRFISNVDYVKRAGFKKVFFWGVEYWYWLKLNNEPEIWNLAVKIWN